MKNQKGITLVALILIIVVLLVLAGISVSLVLSNEEKTPSNTLSDQKATNNVGFEYEPEEGEMPEPIGDEELTPNSSNDSFITTPNDNNVVDNTVGTEVDNEGTNEPAL